MNGRCRGYIRAPIKKFINILKGRDNCDVVTVDEYRTTKLCNSCFEPMEDPVIRDRQFYCENCSQIFELQTKQLKRSFQCCGKKVKRLPREMGRSKCSQCNKLCIGGIFNRNMRCSDCSGRLLIPLTQYPYYKCFVCKTCCRKYHLNSVRDNEGCPLNSCQGELKRVESASKHRYKRCTTCHKTRHRDFNAACSILLKYQLANDLPRNFQRGVNLNEPETDYSSSDEDSMPTDDDEDQNVEFMEIDDE